MPSFYDLLARAVNEADAFALGVLSGIKGSSPQKAGAKAVFLADGRILGTLGGGCLEAEVQDRARRALHSGKPATFDLVLDHDFGWDDGLICGGRVSGLILPNAASATPLWRTICARDQPRTWGVREDFSVDWAPGTDSPDWRYQETVLPPADLWIAGAGHVAQAVAPRAVELDFRVTVFDDRPALLNSANFPPGVRLRTGDWGDLLAEPLPQGPVFGLIVTRGHQHDALVLKHWISRPFTFLGMIGSGRKRRIITERFLAEGIASAAALEQVLCPVGAPIGAVTVPEIAVSIVAQLVEHRGSWRQTLAAGSPGVALSQ